MKRWKKLVFTINLIKNRLWNYKKQLWKPCRKSSAKSPEKMKKLFLEKTFCSETFLWTLRIYFWQPYREKFANGPKHFCWKSGKDKLNFVFLKKLYASLRRSSGHVGCSLDNPAETFCQNSHAFCWKSEIDKNLLFSLIKTPFSSKVIFGPLEGRFGYRYQKLQRN